MTEASITTTESRAARPGHWHVSPWIDVPLYHFGWALVLIPLLFRGPEIMADWGYVRIYALILILNFVHRNYGFPFAYLDSRVFRFHRTKLILFPGFCLALVVAVPIAAQLFGTAVLEVALTIMLVADSAWNLWHTLMQKYGILRLYNKKALAGPGLGVPGWIDRLFVFGWMPLVFVALGSTRRNLIEKYAGRDKGAVLQIADALASVQTVLLPLTAVFLLAVIVLFARAEWRVHRFRSRPRLSMAVGLLAVAAALLIVDPVKVFISIGFNHAIEYIAYVWATQRERYGTASGRPVDANSETVLARLLRRPILYYAVFTIGLALVFLYLTPWWNTFFGGIYHDETHFGVPLSTWFLLWGSATGLIHYYTDGFLWKLRYTGKTG